MAERIDKLYAHWRHQHDLVATLTKLFIVGCPKSGTTWLVNLLNGHPHVFVHGEASFGTQLLPAMQKAFAFFNDHQQKFDKPAETRLQELDTLLLGRVAIDTILARFVQASGRDVMDLRVIGDKTPQHALCAAALAGLYPDARLVHVLRDPRDAAVSGWFHFGRTSGKPFDDYIAYFVQQVWAAHVAAARQAMASLGERMIEVRYEDLHADEPAQLARLLRHVGVDASAERVAACSAAGSFSRMSGGRQRGQEDPASLARKGVVGDWQNHLAPDLAHRACAPVARLVEAAGYDPAPVPAAA